MPLDASSVEGASSGIIENAVHVVASTCYEVLVLPSSRAMLVVDKVKALPAIASVEETLHLQPVSVR